MIRRTRQREAIEAVLRREQRPLTPPEIHLQAARRMPRLGLRTVYRQIRDLTAEGLVVGVDYPGQPLRYEWVRPGHHAHFICRSCAQVYDLEIEVPDVPVTPPPGFTVSGQETVFYGICRACSAGVARG
jgi:Fur family ferric uptake transcriptional regulator